MALRKVTRRGEGWVDKPKAPDKRRHPVDASVRAAPATSPTDAKAAAQRRYQLRRTCHQIVIHSGNDPDLVMQAVQQANGLELSREEALALIVETRAWQRENYSTRASTTRMDQIDRTRGKLPTMTGSALISAEALLARLEGNEAPIQIRGELELGPEVMAVLKSSSPEELERYIARALAARGKSGA